MSLGGKNKCDSAHLARASLWKIADDIDLLGGGEGTNDLADLEDELFNESRLIVHVMAEFTTTQG